MDKNRLLMELDRNNFQVFHFNEAICHVRLEDDFEIILQLSNGSVPAKRAQLLKAVLKSYDMYLEKAVRQLRQFHIDIGESCDPYGLFVGEFSFGSHGWHLFDGFTISLKREDGTENDPLNAEVYTVQFKENGWPLGIDLWFE